MIIALDYRLRQRTKYRTRITFSCLKQQPERCDRVQRTLVRVEGIEDALVRPATGSVILVHPRQKVNLRLLLDQVAQALDPDAASAPCPGPRRGAVRRADAVSQSGSVGHVSGPILLLSGLYLLYLYVKRVVLALAPAPAVITPILTLPALVAFGLSLPIQRQGMDNLRRTGKPDMGLISTGLLYFSLLTGRTLAALTVFWLFNLSSWLEDRIRIRTRQAVREMLSGACQRAWLLRDGLEIEVDAASLHPGDVIVLRLGNVVPADGTVLSGSAFVDEAALTGEDEPVPRHPEDTVLAGTVLVDGALRVRVDRSGEDTRLAAIIRLIEHAEHDPGELQLKSLRLSQTMVPVSLSLAAAALLFTGNLMQAMAVLIITCPCSLRLSTSVAISGAMSSAAHRGLLIKGGRYVEIAGQVDVLAVDKTGTLTDRTAEVTGITVLDRRFREESILGLAAGAQQAWAHPLSRALVEGARARLIPLPPVEEPELVIGQGVRARVDHHEVMVGRDAFLREQGIRIGEGIESRTQGFSNLLVACDGRLIGMVHVRHRRRPGLAKALARLRALGIHRLVLLSGDRGTGFGEGVEYGFDQVLCNQSPEAKAAWISAWKREHPGDVVAMVGDGINDTPAFAAADLSLAIGEGGADVTVEYADIVLQRGGLDQAADALALGQRTLRTIRESYGLAMGLNGIILVLTTLGLLSPVAGALLHNLTTVLAVANASTPGRRPNPTPGQQDNQQSSRSPGPGNHGS
ncbi:heavy metal translocating P-type ATPase [Desulfobulbus propionicus]|jgi:cation-transporting P-type ATPase C